MFTNDNKQYNFISKTNKQWQKMVRKFGKETREYSNISLITINRSKNTK